MRRHRNIFHKIFTDEEMHQQENLSLMLIENACNTKQDR